MRGSKEKKYINNFVEKLMLRLFKIGCDEKNFLILNNLPSTTKNLGKLLDLSPMPIHYRINNLENVGLLKRQKKYGKIIKSEITDKFIDNINSIKLKVIETMANQKVKK